MVVYVCSINNKKWQDTVLINLVSQLIFTLLILGYYGNVSNDYIIHVPVAFIVSSILIRLNDFNKRHSFN